MPVYRRMHGAASCRMSDSVAEIGVDGALCHIGVSNSIPGFLPRSWGQCQLRSGEGGTWRFAGLMGQRQLRSGGIGTQTQGAAEDGSVSRSISSLDLRWWPGRGCGPGLLTPQVGAGDHPGQDAQTAPQRLLLLGGVRHRPLVSRWVPSVGPSHSAPSRGSRRQPCGRRSRRVSASSLQCERRDGRSEPPMRGCMYVPRPYMHPPGEDPQPTPHCLPLLGGVCRRPAIGRWSPRQLVPLPAVYRDS